MPFGVYRSSDTGAPSAPKDIIKSCLVTGYGSKSAAGWQLVGETANEVAVAPVAPGGYRQYVYAARVGSTQVRWVMGTGVIDLSRMMLENPYPAIRERNVSQPGPILYIERGSSWIVVADEHSMFWAYYPAGSSSSILFAGYVKPIAAGPLFRPARLHSSSRSEFELPVMIRSVAHAHFTPPLGDEEAVYRGLYRGPTSTATGEVYDGIGRLSGHTLLAFQKVLVDITLWEEI